jgi:hypothetical protein
MVLESENSCFIENMLSLFLAFLKEPPARRHTLSMRCTHTGRSMAAAKERILSLEKYPFLEIKAMPRHTAA